MRDDGKMFRLDTVGDSPTLVIRITGEDLTSFLTWFCIGFIYMCAMRGIARS
jgi:hypothetical protein